MTWPNCPYAAQFECYNCNSVICIQHRTVRQLNHVATLGTSQYFGTFTTAVENCGRCPDCDYLVSHLSLVPRDYKPKRSWACLIAESICISIFCFPCGICCSIHSCYEHNQLEEKTEAWLQNNRALLHSFRPTIPRSANYKKSFYNMYCVESEY